MKTRESVIYIAEDGKEFISEKECISYEEDLQKKEKYTTYWNVIYQPDLTEGRGYYGSFQVEFYNEHTYILPESWLQDWCFQKFGKKIEYVMGVSPIENWKLSRISSRSEFLKDGHTWVGDYRYKSHKIRLKLVDKFNYQEESIS